MRTLYWRILALWRGHPFLILGNTLLYCYACAGWGSSVGGDCCPRCNGRGFRPLA